MSVSTSIAIYFLIWWIVLFAILPWGIHSQSEGDAMPVGTDPGAPILPKIGLKLIWTTIISTAVFAGCYVVYVEQLVTLDGLAALLGMS